MASVCTPSRYALLTGEYAFRKKGTGTASGIFNVLPALLGEKLQEPCREYLVEQDNTGNALALRKGSWKFIPGAGKGKAEAKRRAGVLGHILCRGRLRVPASIRSGAGRLPKGVDMKCWQSWQPSSKP